MGFLRRSIGVRVTLAMTGILAVFLIAGSTFLNNRLAHFLEQWETRQAEVQALSLMATLQTLMLNGEGTLAREWIERMLGVAGILDMEVLRLDGDQAFTDLQTVKMVNDYVGTPLFARQPFQIRRAMQLNEVAFEESLAGRMAADWSHRGRVTLYLPIPAQVECLACHGYDNAPLRGVLRLSLSTEEMEQWSAQLQRWSLGGVIVLPIVLGLMIWLSVHRNVLSPLARLKRAILYIGEQNGYGSGTSFPFQREDEIGEVAAAFSRMRDKLHDSESRSRAIAENIPDVIVTTDEHGEIVTVNNAVTRVFGYTVEELLGRNAALIIPDSRRRTDGFHGAARREAGSTAPTDRVWEAMGRHRSDRLFPVEISLNEFLLHDERRFIAVIRDITERKEQLAAIEHQAMHDALTDLPNRTLFAQRLQRGLRHSLRHDEPLALVIMDLDRFKEINDTLGHVQGDLLLQQVALRLSGIIRDSDTVARLGGDEFAMLLPCTGEEAAACVARRLIEAFEHPFMLQQRPYVLGISAGIALCPRHGADETSLMRYADIAMYAAKRGGHGYALYDPEQDPHSQQRLDLVSDLRSAVGHGEFELHYQPKVRLGTRRVVGVEGLIRWRHPRHGLMMPYDFIPHAERHGLTRSLTAWVIGEACRQSRTWHDAGLDISIAINLSMHDLEDPELIGRVREHLEGRAYGGAGLYLEVTETAMMSHPARVVQTLHELSGMGFSISIDDFGTGYSSLTYLRQLSLSEIKIDRSFVMDMLNNREAETIVRAIIDLAHNLGLQVVAEGASDEMIYDRLLEMGCDVAQGFFIARPMIAEAFSEWLHSSPWRES